jgi:hypothetical protein
MSDSLDIEDLQHVKWDIKGLGEITGWKEPDGTVQHVSLI